MEASTEKPAKSRWGEMLKSAFLKDETPPETNAAVNTNAATPNTATAQSAQPAKAVAGEEQIESTPAYKSLSEAVLARVSPFTSFLKTYKSLESIIPDSNQRLVAAVRALESTGGYSSDQINQSIAMHVGLLESAKKKFEKDMAEQLDQSVGSLEAEHGEITKAIEQKKADITRLQSEIVQAEARQGTLGAKITEAKGKFEAVARTFSVSAEYLGSMIRSYQQKLGNLR